MLTSFSSHCLLDRTELFPFLSNSSSFFSFQNGEFRGFEVSPRSRPERAEVLGLSRSAPGLSQVLKAQGAAVQVTKETEGGEEVTAAGG